MTPTELIGQLMHTMGVPGDFNNAYIRNMTLQWGGLGGSYWCYTLNPGMCSNNTCHAVALNQLQQWVVNNTRLGIPLTIVSETLHSATNGATVFPMPVSMGATWNQALVEQIGATIAYQSRSFGIHRGYSPELNVPTDPRWGRTEENFSEDPRVVSLLGAAMIIGMQGNTGGPSTYLDYQHVAVEAKHAVAYAYSGLDWASADIGPVLWDVYLKPWRMLGQMGGRGLMASHNAVNGMPMHANYDILTGVLRNRFNLSLALFASDDQDIPNLTWYHIVANQSEAAVAALTAGMDQEMPPVAFPTLLASYEQGLVDLATLQTAAARVLRPKFAAGLFDNGLMINISAVQNLDNSTNRALARQAAREGIVLLQNLNGVLPLSTSGLRRVAVIGPNGGCPVNVSTCNATSAQEGGYTNGGAQVITVAEAVTIAGGNGSAWTTTWAQGANIADSDTSLIGPAVALAQSSDLVIAVVGDSTVGYGTSSCGEGVDRDSLDLPGSQLQLLQALAQATQNGTSPPLVVVLIHGRPATFGADAFSSVGPYNSLLAQLPAVLTAWRPGEEGGGAVWDVLTGAYNPSGRLAQTWPRSVGDVRQRTPWYQQWAQASRPYFPDVPVTPLFPFGFGLSYTNVTPTAISLAPTTVSPGGFFNATVTLRSQGPQVDFAVQVYFSQNQAVRVRFQKMLAGFTKVTVPANSDAFTATVTIPVDELAYWDQDADDYVLDNAQFTISTGLNSADTPVSATLTLVGGRDIPPASRRGRPSR